MTAPEWPGVICALLILPLIVLWGLGLFDDRSRMK